MSGLFSTGVLMPWRKQKKLDYHPMKIPDTTREIERHSLEINHRLGWGTLTSQTSFFHTEDDRSGLTDRRIALAHSGMSQPGIRGNTADEKNINQDFRLASLPDSSVFWVGGVNFGRSVRSMDDSMSGNSNWRDFKVDSQAIYGEVTFPLNDRFKLTTGARHTHEEKRLDALYDKAANPMWGIPASTTVDKRKFSDNYTTGRVALSYALSRETNLYGVLSRG